MEEGRVIRNPLAADLSRRQFIGRASGVGLGAVILGASGLLDQVTRPAPAFAADPNLIDGTMQAFFDTMIPGSPATITDLGNPIHSQAIAGVDEEPGAVEADALLLSQNAKLGFTLLQPPFLAELEVFAALRGNLYLNLDYERRQAVCVQGLAFSNPTRVVWEAAAAIAFTAFCAAATQPNASSATASGYEVMGLPGAAPNGYDDFSYGRALSAERTQTGSMP